jgi:hypothetical protein
MLLFGEFTNFGKVTCGDSACFGSGGSELTACPTLMTFDMRVLHKIFPNSYKFCASQHGVNYTFHRSFHTYRPNGKKFPKRSAHLNICEFSGNWRSEGYNFVMVKVEVVSIVEC